MCRMQGDNLPRLSGNQIHMPELTEALRDTRRHGFKQVEVLMFAFGSFS